MGEDGGGVQGAGEGNEGEALGSTLASCEGASLGMVRADEGGGGGGAEGA